ncbi:MAG: GAF domain-containing protein [Acetobacteraceae bacterium]|nr:GAF domain-containing protein [Acetobacteraceae bacterium]
MLDTKRMLIERLTGIHSSKKNYYFDLKKKIEETAKRNTQLEILNQMAKSVNIDMSLEEMLESVTQKLRTVISFDQLSLSVIEDGRVALRASVPAERGKRLPQGQLSSGSVLHRVAESRQPLVWERRGREGAGEEDERLKAEGIATAAFLPLLAKNRVVGVLYLGSRDHAYSQPDLMFLGQMADHLAVFLENARLYREVLRSKVEWEETFAAVTDLIYVIDPGYRVVRVNQAVPEFFGLPVDQVVGRRCFEALHGRDQRCDPCPAAGALASGRTSFQQLRTPTGRILDVFSYPLFNEQRQLYGAIQYAKDVTQIVHSIKFVALGEMAAGVAHELNSPLTAIIGDAQLLLRDLSPDDPRYELIADIKNCGHRSRRIIQNLLAFSRQEEYSFGATDLNEVVERALALVGYQIEKSNVVLEKLLAPGLPRISADGQRLEQVLINLLLNAKDAVEEQEGQRRITIRTRAMKEREAEVSVADTGHGIKPEHLPHIFNPFFTTKKAGKGTGLGLSVSLGIVETHGGRILVESEPGRGSTFTVILPVDRKTAEGADEPAPREGRRAQRGEST